MSTPDWDDKLHVRSNRHARLAGDRLRSELRAGPLRFFGKRLTQESMVAALLMWAESQGAGEVARGLGPQLRKLEALMGYEETVLRGNTKGVGGDTRKDTKTRKRPN